jgi:predicted glycosyltransferase
MRFELAPLLEAAHGHCLTVCSVRDILVERTAARHTEARDLLRDRFDLVLVHGDRSFIGLGATFPEAAAVENLIRYTGFLGGDAAAPATREGEIVVSAGGGAVGQHLEEAARSAADETPDRPWRLLVGGNRPDAALADLQKRAPANLTVERARRDFRGLLARAAASVSQAGYNTVMDVLAARPPAVLVPFAAGRETEQTVRAARLADLGLAVHLPEADLTPDSLKAAVDRAIALGPPAHGFALDGARRSVALVEAALTERRGP